VDDLAGCAFRNNVFRLLRSWHDAREHRPALQRLTVVMAFALEKSQLIDNLHESPFNVGTDVLARDFTRKEIEQLNDSYGRPLASEEGLSAINQLVGGHPYLVHNGIYHLAQTREEVETFIAAAVTEEGVYGDHLRHLQERLDSNPELSQVVLRILKGEGAPSWEQFYRLRSRGLLRGDSPQKARLRCKLYEDYLRVYLT
jgi:hypothetical protein